MRRARRLAGRMRRGVVRVALPGRVRVRGTGTGPRPEIVGPVGTTDRLQEALALVAEAERLDPALPQMDHDVLLLARDRVVRRPEIGPEIASLLPPRERDGWRAGAPGVETLRVRVATDLVVLGKFDLQRRPKLRAVYADRALTLVVQPSTPSSGIGVGRAVRAHEVVERHAPDLIPAMLGHGLLSDGVPYLVERWVPGRPLNDSRRLTAAAPRILAGLAAVHRGHGVSRVRLTDHWGEGLRERWQRTSATGIVPADLSRWVEDLIERDGTLRVSFIHGDLVASNVLATDDGVVLVDWEQAHEGVLMNDAAKIHLFGADPEDVLDVVLAALGQPGDDAADTEASAGAADRGGTPYLPLEELALCHAQLVSLYPRRSARLEGHARQEVYERQVRRQVERLQQVRSRA